MVRWGMWIEYSDIKKNSRSYLPPQNPFAAMSLREKHWVRTYTMAAQSVDEQLH